jgi:hypothetical protein
VQFAERLLPSVVVVQHGNQPIGFASWRLYGGTMHVAQVVVDPDARRRGAGRALMADLQRRALAKGCTRWYLNVKADNAAAIALYQGFGLRIEQPGWALVADWTDLQRLRGSTDTERFEPSHQEASDFARQHAIDPERLAQVRSRPAVVFVAQRALGKMCAFAAFDPGFPGIYPLAVTVPEHARGLFDALIPHARHPYVNIFVEGNAALATVLQAGGAKLQFATLRMGAALTTLPDG